MFKKKPAKPKKNDAADKVEGLDAILPPLNVPHVYDPELGKSSIDCLIQNLDKCGIGSVVERCKDKNGVDHYNVAAHYVTAGDVSLQTSGRIDENATPVEALRLFATITKALLP